MSDDNGSDDDGSDDDSSDDDGSDDDSSDDDGSDDDSSDDDGSDDDGSDDDSSDDDSSESSINARLSDITRRMSLIRSRRTTNTASNSGADTPSLLSAHTSDNDSSQWSIGMSETNGLPNITPAVLIVDPDEGSVDMSADDMSADDTSADDVDWERLIVALARYHALRQEAAVSLVETATSWPDTPSSLRDVQAFQPPTSRQDMQAFLQQSLQNYPR
ncbi:hypothetical protein K438DRAFT_1853740 [Mycena galopus ATCC 62051]|nr:hypothetical protein K438DRAFT_1853740 [Mycena galopus ATCC 62051]